MARRIRSKSPLSKYIALILIALLLGAGSLFVYPDVSRLKFENPKKTSFMEFRESEWKKKGKKIIPRQTWVPLSRVSPYLIKSVLIAEDDKFWQHEGFDFEAIEKAIEKDIRQKKLKFGGSTISQQLAKNLYLSPSRNLLRKAMEAVLTWRIEHALSKRRILELYLNCAEWGEGIFGIETASFHYYGKPASDLGPKEAARLASVLPNPIKYDPTGASGYVEKRSHVIYNIMIKRGIIPEEYYLQDQEE